MKVLLVIALAGCTAAPAQAPDAAIVIHTCTASFTGNFAEASTSESNCPTMADTTFALSLSTQALGAPLVITVDLGAMPSVGTYTPETVTSWNARGIQPIGQGECVYSAGNDVVPHGDFALELDATARHGTFTSTEYVLAFPETDCGDDDTESVQVAF
ncbi:MAG TPA: hypothetical protein VGO00_15950 [Kofleriaceae bacterium]|nr:hypothetical protein [Kofleriaceae bacterium]